DVRGERHREAEADGRPVDGGDHRLLHLEDPQRDEAPAIVVVLRCLRAARTAGERRATAAEVGARAERPTGAGDDHRAHAVVAVRRIEGLDQLADHRGVDGVEPVGPVQCDRGHAVSDVVEQRLEPHAQNPSARTALPAAAGSVTAGAVTASFLSWGITSLANSRMLRSASSYGMPA